MNSPDDGLIDLHLHTLFSDGTFTPEELVQKSKKAKLSAIAIVDHDTTDAIDRAFAAAKKENIEVLPGIELSAEFEGREVHILGYLIDYKDARLIKKLEELNNIRRERIYKIAGKLNDLGIRLEPDDVFKIARQGTVGRLHVARALVNLGTVDSIYEAFRKYLGDDSPAFVLGFRFSPAEAIQLIKQVGGIPVLAHPYTLNNDELINRFIKEGIMGLEVHYPEHSQSMVNFYLDIAKKFNLLVTGGSDCHGTAKPDVKIGCVKVPYELVEKLKAVKENIK
jgi:3',5'-nucleoside bisphosphate phosphatase